MKANDFCRRCEALFGYGWRTKLAASGVANYATVKRWASGRTPVPGPVVVMIEALELLKAAKRRLPQRFTAAC